MNAKLKSHLEKKYGIERCAQMFSALAEATKKFINSGFQVVAPKVLSEREATCRACEWWDAAALKGTGRCRKCGCSTWAKLRMATERCPIGKWEAHLTSPPN